MILFALPQDDVMSHILENALGLLVAELQQSVECKDDAFWRSGYPLAERCFATETALRTAQQLLEISREPDCYRITDYHWLLLYDSLESFCELCNDEARQEPDGRCRIGPYAFRKIDFDNLVELYFWDNDFLMPFGVVGRLGGKRREQLGIDDHVFGISQGWDPHPDELRVERLTADSLPYTQSEPLHFPDSTRYPDPRPSD